MISGLSAGGSLGLLGFYRTREPSGAEAAAASVTLASGQAGPEDTVFLSAEAQEIVLLAAQLNDLTDEGGGADPAVDGDRLLALAAALGPVVVNGSGSDTAPEVEIVRRGVAPDYGSAAFASAAEAIRASLGASPTPGATEAGARDFASVRTGAGDDVIQIGGAAPPAAPGEQLTGLVDAGAGNDRVIAYGNTLVRGGAGDDTIEAAGGNLLVAFGQGDGTDEIRFDDTLGSAELALGVDDAAQVTVTQDGADLLLSLTGTGESLRLRAYDPAARGGSVTFGDGTKRSLADLVA